MRFFEKFPTIGNITINVKRDGGKSWSLTRTNVRGIALVFSSAGYFTIFNINGFSGTNNVRYIQGYADSQSAVNTFYNGVRVDGTNTSQTAVESVEVINENNLPIVVLSNSLKKNLIPNNYIANVTATTPALYDVNMIYCALINASEKKVLYHDIYIEGNEKANNIYIHTHHNIDYGRVSSYRYNSFATGGNLVFKANKNEGNYELLGFSQYDKGMIQDYTMEKLFSLGVDNTRAQDSDTFGYKAIAIKFKDVIVDESNPTGDNHFTNYAVVHEDKTHAIVNNSSGEQISDLVVIRFFDGEPPDDVKRNSDSGDDRDDTNYDGTPKDPRTKDDYDDDGELTQGSDEGSAGIFNDIYKVTDVNMRSLHNKIWSQDYFNVLKVNSDPIENIISCKRFPFSANASTEKAIVIGNIDTGVNGAPVGKGIYRVDLGSIYIGEKFKCFLDYYQTNYSIYLPFIGLKELPATQVVGHRVIVKYIVDIMTGVCKAQLYLDSASFLFAEYDGLMGIDCTLTSSNQKQAELVNATRFINAGMSVATGNPMGIATAITGLATNGVENHYHSTQSNSAIANASVVDCFLIYDEPQVPIANGVYPNNYAKTVGLPCGRSYKIGECSGYTKCGGDVQGTFPRATSEEVDEIMNLLQNGIEV